MKTIFTPKRSLLFLFPLFIALTSREQATIAQQLDYGAGSIGFANYTDPMMGFTEYQGVAQVFKSLVTGQMGTLQFYAQTGEPGTTNIEIYSCSSPTDWGSLIATKTAVPVTVSDGWVTADVTALNISLTAGNYYGFRLLPQTGVEANIGVSNQAYPDGQSFYMPDDGSVNSFGGYNLAFSAATATSLPITLSSFTARKQNNNVLLQWSTASEQNSKDFTVQHSTDGNNWNAIATLPAAGNSNTAINYSYIHSNPGAGNHYYRLQQTDMDGKSSLSDTRIVQLSAAPTGFTVLSNPVSNGVLQLQINNPVILSLYSSDGRLLWKKQLAAGFQSMDMSRYGKGIYWLKGNEAAEKILVQ
ncbi:MAG TPA: T9SS type A sorting domain-containing protein [Chitinophagaceae bacterium]|jgi:hypothetical protein